MSYYDEMFELAKNQNGIITTSQITSIGADSSRIKKLMEQEKLARVHRGVYLISNAFDYDKFDDGYDAYNRMILTAAALAVNDGAYIYGESVIDLLKLAPTTVGKIYVATDKRCRRKLPQGVKVIQINPDAPSTKYKDVPAQPIEYALQTALKTMMRERVLQAAVTADQQGLLDPIFAKKFIISLEEQTNIWYDEYQS